MLLWGLNHPRSSWPLRGSQSRGTQGLSTCVTESHGYSELHAPATYRVLSTCRQLPETSAWAGFTAALPGSQTSPALSFAAPLHSHGAGATVTQPWAPEDSFVHQIPTSCHPLSLIRVLEKAPVPLPDTPPVPEVPLASLPRQSWACCEQQQ